MIRDSIYRDVIHTFDMQDLLPVERQIIDTVIESTVRLVCEDLEASSSEPDHDWPMSLWDASQHVRESMNLSS